MPRKSTFNASETNKLMEICVKFKNIIECKKTDVVSVKEKEKAWERIAADFNLNNEIPREAKDLQKKYKNVKYLTKSKAAEQRKQLYGTGGGPSTPSASLSTVEERMFSMLNEKESHGIPNIGDSDTVLESVEDDDLDDECANKRLSPSLPKEKPRSAAAILKTKVSEPLWTGAKKPKENSWEKLAAVKSKWSEPKLQAQTALAQKEKEKIELEIELMQAKHNVHMKHLQEMHEIEMQISKVRLEREILELKKIKENEI